MNKSVKLLIAIASISISAINAQTNQTTTDSMNRSRTGTMQDNRDYGTQSPNTQTPNSQQSPNSQTPNSQTPNSQSRDYNTQSPNSQSRDYNTQSPNSQTPNSQSRK